MTTIPIGSVFRMLTVIGIQRVYVREKTQIFYRVKCTCGNTTRTTAHRLMQGQLSCGCARGGQRGQGSRGKRSPAGYRTWSPEVEKDALHFHAQGYGVREAAIALHVARTTLRDFYIKAGLLQDVTAEVSKARVLEQMPPGVVFEDMPAAVVAREPRGPKPRTQARYSETGCAAALCVG